MSFNRLNYDMCQYKQTITESTRPGNYMLATPPVSCDYCYPSAPTVRLQKAGDSINRQMPLIDTDSELKNIRPASKCKESFSNPSEEMLTHYPDCFPHTIESRDADPASNLRGTGFDRWEYLCFNPQDHVAMPFDNNISNRILVKDNHRPDVPCPQGDAAVRPPATGPVPCEKTTPVCSNPTFPPGIKCKSTKTGYYSY